MTRRRRVRWLALSVFTGFVATALPALGAPSAKDQSAKLYEEGVKAAKAGEWEKACRLLGEAFTQRPHYQIAANLGRAELMAGRPREAAVHLSFFLREAKTISNEDRRAAEQMLANAKAKLGTLTLEVSPVGAELFVDGQKAGMAPLEEPVFALPGRRRIEARKAGLVAASQEIEVRAGEVKTVALDLDEKVESALGPQASKERSRRPGGELKKPLLYSGISVSAGLAALGIGTAIGAGLTHAASQRQLDDAGGRQPCNSSASCTTEYNDRQRLSATLATSSVYSLTGAMLTGAASAVYAWTGAKSQRLPEVSVAITPQGGSVTLKMVW